jgi:uncharacterized membrane protein YdjX (TVP38/TMEM64 family)
MSLRTPQKPIGPRLPEDAPGTPPIELEIEVAQSAGASERKFLIMALVVAVCVAIIHFTPLKQYVTDVQRWKDLLRGLGLWAPLLFGLVSAAFIAGGVPRLIFGGVAGMLFGFWEGFAVAQLSAILGSYSAFLLARWGGREWGARRIEKSRRLRELLKNPSIFSVFLVRQLPIAGIVPNLVLGLTSVRHRVFLIGSFLGFLPSCAMVVLIGSGLGKQTLARSLGQITLAMLVLGTVSTLVWHLKRKLSGRGKKAEGEHFPPSS